MAKQTMTKRYYSSSSAINYPPLLKLYHEAVADAKQKLVDDPEKNEIHIVQVVAVVKRIDPIPPIEVITVE